ncbi:MAG: hypothetical protein HOV78_11355 [Hamadaea sp.]|nr:hypothetical protein [Hamadaea sp.]
MTDRIRTPEPGAVAMVRYSDSDGPWVVGIATTPRGNWRTQEHGSTFSIAEARPLVVIDPDDREQVERLARDLHDRIHKSGSFDVLSRMSQDVPRRVHAGRTPLPRHPAQARRADRPGAVVEDADGYRWVFQGGPQPAEGQVWFSPNLNGTALYREITAVRVVSEGVPA